MTKARNNVTPIKADETAPGTGAGTLDPDRVAAALSADRAQEIAAMFHLLGEPHRLAILAACLAGPRPVHELADLAGTSPSLTSHHLRLLKAARLVRAERHGKFVHYSVHDHHVASILKDMIEHVSEPHSEEES